MKDTIQEIINQRRLILNADYDDPKVDEMANDVWAKLREHQDQLPVEFILESLTHLGAAPSLLYDDDAHWTIGGDGSQNILALEDRTKETTFDATWWVGPNRWRKTIREAIRDYLEERSCDP